MPYPTDEPLKVHASNMAEALRHAITMQEAIEKGRGYTSDSNLLGGWRRTLEALEAGREVIIR